MRGAPRAVPLNPIFEAAMPCHRGLFESVGDPFRRYLPISKF